MYVNLCVLVGETYYYLHCVGRYFCTLLNFQCVEAWRISNFMYFTISASRIPCMAVYFNSDQNYFTRVVLCFHFADENIKLPHFLTHINAVLVYYICEPVIIKLIVSV